jgi:hypothetical protein
MKRIPPLLFPDARLCPRRLRLDSFGRSVGTKKRKLGSMKGTHLLPLLCAVSTLALAGGDKMDDAKATIKQDAREVGHTIARGSKQVGQAVARDSKAVGHAVAEKSKQVGHTIAQDSKKVGAAVAHSTRKVKATVTERSARQSPAGVTSQKADDPK